MNLKSKVVILKVTGDLSPLLRDTNSLLQNGAILNQNSVVPGLARCSLIASGNSANPSGALTVGTRIKFTEFEQRVHYLGDVPHLRGSSALDLMSNEPKVHLHCDKSDGSSFTKTDFLVQDLNQAFGRFGFVDSGSDTL